MQAAEADIGADRLAVREHGGKTAWRVDELHRGGDSDVAPAGGALSKQVCMPSAGAGIERRGLIRIDHPNAG
ncbi:hypothetical protein G6F32_017546 [Rhizopus arrhizus]|nr:hypothetical protein G6F32_017546 [Rhizopus arrhizus]